MVECLLLNNGITEKNNNNHLLTLIMCAMYYHPLHFMSEKAEPWRGKSVAKYHICHLTTCSLSYLLQPTVADLKN